MLDQGWEVHGYDGMTDYYDVSLKKSRLKILLENPMFTFKPEAMLEDEASIDSIFDDFLPEVVIHLAAQAGVRYSLENPRAYLDSKCDWYFQHYGRHHDD